MPTTKTLAVFDALAGRPPATDYPQLDLRNDIVLLDFDDAVAEKVDFLGVIPVGYAASDFEVVVTWCATTATSGDVVWSASLERHPVGDPTHGTHDLDVADFGAATSVTATAPSSSGELARSTIAVTAASADAPVAGDSFRLRIERSATDVADTMTGDAELLIVELREV